MFVVVQPDGVFLRIIERQVDIVGKVGEDVCQMEFQYAGQVDLNWRTGLVFDEVLGGN